jgi:serine/threonine-protein kinase
MEFVGGGGMGAVFRARDTRLDRIVALKVLAREHGSDEETVRRFRNEAQSAARLDHENIARAYHIGEDKGIHYITFEFIEGVNIRELVHRRGPLPLADVIHYTLQLADALAHASSREVVHRDIKPSNVLITPGRRAKLVDMGLARVQFERSSGDLTASGVTLGTFDYISPEQARDPRSADVRSDIYSLGCTVYYMLTGQPPFPQGTVLQKLLQHQADTPPDPRSVQPKLPIDVSRLVLRMLAKDPADRYQSPAELIADLLALAARMGLDEPVPRETAPLLPRLSTVSWWERHLPWIVPTVVLVAIVGLLQWTTNTSDIPAPHTLSAANKNPAPAEAPQTSARPKPNSDQPARESAPRAKADDPPVAQPRESTQPTTSATVTTPAPKEKDPSVTPSDREASLEDAPSPATDAGFSAEELSPAVEPNGLGPKPLRAELASPAQSAALEFATGNTPNTVSPSSATPTSSSPTSAAPTSTASTSPMNEVALASNTMTRRFVVGDQPDNKTRFANLRAACAAANDGDTIVLEFNGRREEKPILLSNRNLTIAAADGYWPMLAFPSVSSEATFSRAMITLVGGSLRLVRVMLELDLMQEQVPSQNWSLFALDQAETLQLEQSALTIKNSTGDRQSFHQDVAFIDIRSAPLAEPVRPLDETTPQPPVTIRLQDCVVRGEALFLRSASTQSLDFLWQNGLLATSERFFVTVAGVGNPLTAQGLQSLSLDHVTAIVRRGFCQLTSAEPDDRRLRTFLTTTNSILVADSDAPLIEQRSLVGPPRFDDHIRWTGENTFYQGFGSFWKVAGSGGSPGLVRQVWPDWKHFWRGPRDAQQPIGWKPSPHVEQPLHDHDPADYLLDDRSPARAAASGSTDAGFQRQALPPMS